MIARSKKSYQSRKSDERSSRSPCPAWNGHPCICIAVKLRLVEIPLVKSASSFRLKEDRRWLLIGKTHHLVFDRRTVAYDPSITPAYIGSQYDRGIYIYIYIYIYYTLMGFLIGMRDVTRHLLRMLVKHSHKREKPASGYRHAVEPQHAETQRRASIRGGVPVSGRPTRVVFHADGETAGWMADRQHDRRCSYPDQYEFCRPYPDGQYSPLSRGI